jgi:hypothetical protein
MTTKIEPRALKDLYKSVASNESEAEIVSQQEKLGTGWIFGLILFTRLKKYLTPILLKIFHKIEREGMLPSPFYEVSIVLIPKQVRSQQKENYSKFPR